MNRTDLAKFLDAGVAMLGATADASRTPEAFRVWGASITADGRLRALVSSDAARTLDTVGPGSRISLLFTDISTFQSVQVKGTAVGGAQPAGTSDVVCLRRYDQRFATALSGIGHPPTLAERLRPTAVFAVSVDIEDLYDQTPGPRAGAPLERDRDG